MPVSKRGAIKGSSHEPHVDQSDWDRLMKQPYRPSGGVDPDFERLLKRDYDKPFDPDLDRLMKMPYDRARLPERPPPGPSVPSLGGQAMRRRVGRMIAGRLLEPYDDIERLVVPLLSPRPYQIPNPQNGWLKCWGDCPIIQPDTSSKLSSCNAVHQMCLGGQSVTTPSGGTSGFHTPLNTDRSYLLSMSYPVTGGVRHRFHSFYGRPVAGPNGAQALVTPFAVGLPMWPMPDPNLARIWSPDALPQGQPMAPSGSPLSPSQPSPLTETSAGPVGAVSLSAVTQIAQDRISPREPPGKGKKEAGKLRGPAQFVRMLFKILNGISESCEVVDAVYDALPNEAKKAAAKGAGYVWSPSAGKYVLPGNGGGTAPTASDTKAAGVGGGGAGSRAFVDNFGQYGIDGCDWKSQAIYKNADKLDTCAAIQNIVKNEIEDRAHGVTQKYRPRGTVNGLAEADKTFGKELNKLLDEYVDFC